MAGVALINAGATKEKLRAPVWWFVDVAVPATTVKMTLTAESGSSGWKSPDATENPNAVCLGCTDDFDLPGEQSYEKDYCQQFANPIGVFPNEQTRSIELSLVGAINATLLVKLMGITNTVVTSSNVMEGGSIETFPTMAIVGVFKMQDDTTKYGYIMYFSCNQVMPWNGKGLTRKKFARTNVKFEALTLSGRAVGKDVFQLVQTI